MTPGIIIQARMGSTRLPKKILKDFYHGETLIETVVNNLKKVEGVKIIVATSTSPNNDELVAFLLEKNVLVYRGEEDDVLNRFIGAAKSNDIDGIVRICSDNPFLDWRGIRELLHRAQNSNADYIGFRINNTPSIKTHFGFWGEYVTLDALNRVSMTTNDKQAHEHVTIHVYTHPEEFNCEWIEAPDYLQGRSDIRLTVDTAEDFKNAQQVYTDLKNSDPDFSLEDVVKYIDENNDLEKSMKRLIENNKK